MLLAILHYIPDLADARRTVARLIDAVPAGSFLVISHAATDLLPDDTAVFEKALNAHLPADHHHVARSHNQVASFFDSVDLVEPGLVRVSDAGWTVLPVAGRYRDPRAVWEPTLEDMTHDDA